MSPILPHAAAHATPRYPHVRPVPRFRPGCRRLRRACAFAGGAARAHRRGLRIALADPGRHHPAADGGPRRAGPGADRHRQDRCVRAADPVAHRPEARQAAGPGAGAHARTGDPGGRGVPALCRAPARPAGAADLRRAELRPAVARAAPRRARHRRHPGACDRSSGQGHARPLRAEVPGARRSRRDAAHGLRRRRGKGAGSHAAHPPGGAVLGHHAGADPQDRAAAPEGTGGDRDQDGHHHRGEHPPALLVRQRRAQAGCDDAHPRGRAVRRDDHLRAHQAGYRGAGRETAGAASPPPRSTATSPSRNANG